MKHRILSMIIIAAILFTSVDLTVLAEQTDGLDIEDSVDLQAITEEPLDETIILQEPDMVNEVGEETFEGQETEPEKQDTELSLDEQEEKKELTQNITTELTANSGLLLEENEIENTTTIVDSGKCGASLFWSLDDSGTLTIFGTGDMRDYDNTSSRMPWYEHKDDLTKVVIEEGITSIGDLAFYSCNAITGNLVLPDGIKEIGESAFFGCSKLSGNLIIPEGVTSIGGFAFGECSNLTGDLIIPEGITSIGNYTFYNCKGFTGNLILPDSVTRIGGSAFAFCSGLTGNLAIPENVTYIGDSAFRYCINFTGELILPEGISKVYGSTFRACSGLTGDLIIPESVTSIGASAFSGCDGLSGDLVIPSSVTSIGSYAFSDCSGLTGNLVIPGNIQVISKGAFSGCSGFKGNLIITEGVISIEESAFDGCWGLTGNLVIPNSVTSIGMKAFNSCSGFKGKLELSSGLTCISSGAFQGCRNLTGELMLPEGISTIEQAAFSDCNNLTGNLIFPDGVKTIAYAAFFDCDKLSGEVYLPESVVSIGSGNTLGPVHTVYGLPNSYAETYAKEKGYTFIPYWKGDPENQIIKDYKDKVCIYVIDAESGELVKNAIINGKAANNENGHFAYDVDEIDKELNISAEGYISVAKYKDFKAGDTCFLPLYKEQGKLGIVEANIETGMKVMDVLGSKFYIVHTEEELDETEMMTLHIKTRGDAEKFALFVGEDIVDENQTGVFTIPIVITENTINTEWNGNEEIYIQVADGNGAVVKKKLGIYIKPGENEIEETDKSGKIEWGSKLSITIPDSVPLIGGETAKFGISNPLPFDLEVERDGRVRILVNKPEGISPESFKDDYKKLESRALKLSDAAAAFGGEPESFGAGYWDMEYYMYGYGEGYIDTEQPGTYKIDIALVAYGKGDIEYKHYMFIGCVPIYINVKSGGEIESSAGVGARYYIADKIIKFEGGIGKISGEIYLAPTVGVGIDGISSISVSGKANLHYLNEPLKEYCKIWYKPSVTASIKLLGKEFPFWDEDGEDYIIYETPGDSAGSGGDGASGSEGGGGIRSMNVLPSDGEQSIYNMDNYRNIDRSYLKNMSSVTTYELPSNNSGLVQDYAYPDAQPQIVSVGEKLYLFWLQDISSRGDENRAAIVYSVSEDGNNWSIPVQLVDEQINQTLDGEFDLFVADDKIYVCWLDASEEYETGISLSDMLQKVRVAYAIVDGNTGTVLEQDIVTETEGCYFQPRVSVSNGHMQIAWIQNYVAEGNQIFADSNTQRLMLYDGLSKSISEIEIGGATEKVTSMDMLVSDNSVAVIYALDRDGSYVTPDDRDVYCDTRINNLKGMAQCIASGMEGVSSITCAGDTCYWYADNNIYYKQIDSAEVKTVYDEAGYQIPAVFQVITDGENSRILWETIDEETVKVSISAIKALGNDEWSLPYVVEHTESDEAGLISGTYLDGQLYMSYLDVQKQEDGSKRHSIYVIEESEHTDLELLYAEYENDTLIPGESLPISAYVINNGNTKIDTVTISMDGIDLAQKDINLGVREEMKIDFSEYIVPEEISSCENHVLKIEAEKEEDSADNSYVLEIGMTDVEVLYNQRLHNGSTWLDISVMNRSNIPTECTLNIRANTKDGDILYTEELGVIGAKEGVSLTIALQGYEENYCTFFVEIETSEEDAIEGNNIEFVYTGYGTDIAGGDLVSTPQICTVTFNSDGGSEVESQETAAGLSIYEPLNPTKEGYKFQGWYLNDTLYDFNTIVTEDMELIAKWIERTRLPQPSANPASLSKVEIGEKIVLSCAASEANIYYTTDGTDPTIESLLYEEPITYEEDMIITATAVQEGYVDSLPIVFFYDDVFRVSFDSSGGTEIECQLVGEEGRVEEPPIPVKEWHHFKGWYLEEELYDFSAEVTKSITLVAKWEEMELLSAPTTNVPDTEEIYRGTSIRLTSDMAGSKIYYTLDGTTPTEESILYRSPIVIMEDTVVSAITVKEGYKDSEVAQYRYVISKAGDVLLEDMPEEGIDAIPEGLWVAGLDKAGYTYTGSAIRPNIRVYDGTTLLVINKDYTISYKNNVKVSEGTTARTAPGIIIKGKGNYEGTVTATFTILPKSLVDTDVTIEQLMSQYNGRTQKKIPTVTWNDRKLRHKLDYVVKYPDLEKNADAYKDVTEAGKEYNILIIGTGNYTGEKTVKFTITNKELISKAYVSKIADQKYTGNAIEPVVTLKHNFTTLTEGTHYTVTYLNNIEIGTATAVITGMGAYSGTKTITFEIVGTSIAGATVSDIPESFVYTGSAITTEDDKWKKAPKLTMLINGRNVTLAEDKDYEISYRSNTDKGVAGIIFTGMGAYSGELQKTFRIQAYDISEDASGKMTVYLESDSFEYVKNGVRPKPVVMFGNKILTEKTDYTVSYRNHYKINDGTDKDNLPAVIIKGKGNFTGTVEESFVITTSDISNLKMTAEDKVFAKNAGLFESEPVIITESGQKLKKGEDYNETLTYCYKEKTTLEDGTVREAGDLVEKEDIVPADTMIEVIAIGAGSYEGLIKSEYRVVRYDISKANVDIPKMDYTGEAVILDKGDIAIKAGDTVLSADDFEIVSYEDNIDRGKAKVTIIGLGEYGGIKTVKFTIKSKLLEWWEGVLARLFG